MPCPSDVYCRPQSTTFPCQPQLPSFGLALLLPCTPAVAVIATSYLAIFISHLPLPAAHQLPTLTATPLLRQRPCSCLELQPSSPTSPSPSNIYQHQLRTTYHTSCNLPAWPGPAPPLLSSRRFHRRHLPRHLHVTSTIASATSPSNTNGSIPASARSWSFLESQPSPSSAPPTSTSSYEFYHRQRRTAFPCQQQLFRFDPTLVLPCIRAIAFIAFIGACYLTISTCQSLSPEAHPLPMLAVTPLVLPGPGPASNSSHRLHRRFLAISTCQ